MGIRRVFRVLGVATLVMVAAATSAHAWSVKDGYFACRSREAFRRLTSAVASKDKQTAAVLVAGGQCLITKGMGTVSSPDVGILGTSTFVYAGTKYWTYTEALSSD